MAATPALADPLFIAFQQALAGRYSLDRELGRGGAGVVYLAREVHLDRLVAIKLLPPEQAAVEGRRERFLREARLAAKLSHPNIIPIHGVETVAGFVFYVMAFIDGETLAHRVRTRGPLSAADGARVIREVAWALAYAHDQGLVHRDVKPENILIEASTGRVLVADFGIASVAGRDDGDAVAGTPEYMSPEQALGGSVTAQSDLYGLGATAFFALSGRLVFEASTATEMLARHVTQPAPPLASVAPALPRALTALVDRCLAKAPAQRPDSGQTVAEQLGVALERRRELPAALRAFVKRQSRLNGGGTLIAGIALVPAAITMSSLFGGSAGWATLTLGVTAAPFAYLVAVARRLMSLGFTHADIGPAFRREIEQAREELAVDRRASDSWLERWLPRIAKPAAAAAVLSMGLGTILPSEARTDLFPFFFISYSGAILSTIGWAALKQRHADVDTEFWSKVWLGRIGKAAFAVARKLLGRQTRASAVTHRATELSLGMAAEQLYESLPRATRQAIGDVPAFVRRLQADAQAMRERFDALNAAITDAGGDAASPVYADIRATRDDVQARLRAAVSALESIRLDLLRLHAGSVTVEGFTTQLGMAAEVSEAVRRLVAAHEEVERDLHSTPTG